MDNPHDDPVWHDRALSEDLAVLVRAGLVEVDPVSAETWRFALTPAGRAALAPGLADTPRTDRSGA